MSQKHPWEIDRGHLNNKENAVSISLIVGAEPSIPEAFPLFLSSSCRLLYKPYPKLSGYSYIRNTFFFSSINLSLVN